MPHDVWDRIPQAEKDAVAAEHPIATRPLKPRDLTPMSLHDWIHDPRGVTFDEYMAEIPPPESIR